MKKFFATAVLALALIGSAFAATNLTPYTSPKGDFTISTPAPFTVKTQTVKTANGTFLSADYSAKEDNGNLLLVGTAVYPEEITSEQLAATVKSLLTEVGGTLEKTEPYEGGTIFVIVRRDGQALIYVKAVGNEGYIVIFFAPTDQVDAAGQEVSDIIGSFTPKSVTK